MSCATEPPREKEYKVPNLDYELLKDSVGSLEQPHHHAFHREPQGELLDFIETLKNDPPAYNVASYMARFGVDEPGRLAVVLVMNKEKVIATKRRIMRRAVDWQHSRKGFSEKYRAQGDE